MHRTDKIIKGYKATVRIVALPTPLFMSLDPGSVAVGGNLDQVSVLADMRAELTVRDFSVDPHGDLYCYSRYFNQFFDFEIDDSRANWEYDDSEVSVLATWYDRHLEEP